MPSSLQTMGDKDLKRLDKKDGLDAVYRTKASVSTNLTTGVNTITYSPLESVTTPNAKVRSVSLSAYELAQLSNAGLGQVDATWRIRSAYVAEVKAGDLITVSGSTYEVLDGGAMLDVLRLLWTVHTRRRR